MDVTAVCALPDNNIVSNKHLAVLDVFKELSVSFLVCLFDLSDSFKKVCKAGKAFFLCGLCKLSIHIGPFEVFALGSGFKVCCGVGNFAAAQLLEPELCVLFFVRCGFFKNCGDLFKAFFSCFALNYFNYDFGGPENDEMFSISANLGSTPWNERTQLLTINIKAKETDQGNYTGNNIVFLIDVSGSMASTNKLNLIKAVFPKFLDALAPTDKISIVTYSNKIKILANGVYADEKEALKKVVNGLSATGGTAGADGLEKAYNVAKSNYIAGGNNRVIIASDGDFNIGRYSQDDLKELVENQLNSGIYLTTLGFGMGNYKDTTMETLAKYGNGGYAYIDNLEEAEKVLVNDLNN